MEVRKVPVAPRVPPHFIRCFTEPAKLGTTADEGVSNLKASHDRKTLCGRELARWDKAQAERARKLAQAAEPTP